MLIITKELLGITRELLLITKELHSITKELLRISKELLRSTKELLRVTKDLLRITKQLLGNTKEVLRIAKELLSITKELQRNCYRFASPADPFQMFRDSMEVRCILDIVSESVNASGRMTKRVEKRQAGELSCCSEKRAVSRENIRECLHLMLWIGLSVLDPLTLSLPFALPL